MVARALCVLCVLRALLGCAAVLGQVVRAHLAGHIPHCSELHVLDLSLQLKPTALISIQ